MSKALISEHLLSAIANAIRSKTGNADPMTPGEMASAIGSISTGGGGITPTGTIQITENGNYDVSVYASANVNVPTGGGGASIGNWKYKQVTIPENNGVTTTMAMKNLLGNYPIMMCLELDEPTTINEIPILFWYTNTTTMTKGYGHSLRYKGGSSYPAANVADNYDAVAVVGTVYDVFYIEEL